MAFTKKLNVRNSAAIIKEVNQMLESGFPKKETYKVVGAKYNVSSRTVQNIMKMEASKQKMEASTKTLDTSLEASKKHYTSAEIVDNICKLGKTDDYCKAFDKVKAKYGNIVLSNGTEVLF